MDNLTNLFKDLTKNFDGFMEKGWVGKSKSILKTLKDIGHSTGQFFMDVLDWTGGLLGKKGKISDDIKNFLDTKFAPDVSAGIYDLFETVAGGFAIMAVLGMSPIKFMSSMGKFLFGSIRILFTTIALALTPVGLGLTLSALTMAFSDEIIRGIENFVGRMKVGFKNIFIDLHNALASTTVGEYVLKLKPKDRIKDWSDEEEAKKYKANKQKEIAALEKSIAGQEQWKELSALPDGGGRRTQEMMQNLKHTKQFRSQEEVKLKAQKSFLAKEKKDLADFESTWSSQLGQSPSKSPYKPDFMSFFPSRESFSSILGEGGSFMDQTMRNEEFRSSAYDDAGGRSIGYGFHVSKDGADKVLTDAQINKSAADLMSGKENLTREEALTIYLAEKKFFSNAAKNWIGATEWEKLNGGQKQALYDMSYNMGAGFYKEGNWPDLKKAIIANDDDGIASGIMLNASGNGPSKYSQDVKGRAQQNITALQRDGRILTPNLWGSGAGGAPVIVTDNSQTSSSENLFSSAGNRATSTHPSFIDQLGGRFNSNVGSLAGG